MFVLLISRSSLKLGHLVSETRSPGKTKWKPCWRSRGHIFIWPFEKRDIIMLQAMVSIRLSIRPSIHPSVICMSVHISFLDDNLSKHQWIFTKFGFCIDIVELWFGIADGQILSNFDGFLPETRPYFHFPMITWVNINVFSLNMVCALILWRSVLVLPVGKFRQILTVICQRHAHIFVSRQ